MQRERRLSKIGTRVNLQINRFPPFLRKLCAEDLALMKVLWLYWTLTGERRVSGLESGTFTPLCWKNNERYTLLPLQPDGIQIAPSDVVHSLHHHTPL